MWTILLPLAVAVSKKKFFTLNLNVYRNAHFQVLNKAKVEFERVVRPLLKSVPKLDKVTLEYVYYHGKGTVPDTNNVCCIADKFFADTLVSAGVLPDDGPKHLAMSTFRPGGVDREHPRIEAIIRRTIPERNHEMKVATIATLSAADVQAALKDYLIKQFPQAKNTESLVFNQAGDGTYEVRFEADVALAPQEVNPKKAAKAQASPPQAPALPATSKPPELFKEPSAGELAQMKDLLQQSAETKPQPAPAPKPAATPAPSPGLFSFEPAPEAAQGPSSEEASAEPPPRPPPGNGLFAEFGKVTNH